MKKSKMIGMDPNEAMETEPAGLSESAEPDESPVPAGAHKPPMTPGKNPAMKQPKKKKPITSTAELRAIAAKMGKPKMGY